MRTSRTTILMTTALLGLGTLIGAANVAGAQPKGPQVLEVGPATTTTTMKPIKAAPVDYCDTHLCLEAEPSTPTTIKPLPADPVDPTGCKFQGPCDKLGPASHDDTCTHGPCDKAPVPQDDDQPCRSDHDARTSCDEGGTTGGTDGDRPGDTGGTTGGTTGGDRLPHTGMDLATYLGAGLGLTGLGFLLKRASRRTL